MKRIIDIRKAQLGFMLIFLLVIIILVQAAVENLYATGQSCTPTGDCTVVTGINTLGSEDGLTGSASGSWAQRGIIWTFTMNDTQSLGTFTSSNITIYNLDFTWTPTGQSDTIVLEYCIGGLCTSLDTFTSADAGLGFRNVTYIAGNIGTFANVNDTTIRFTGVAQNQGPDSMTVILDAVSIDVDYEPPTILSSSGLSPNTIFNLESATVEGQCNCTGNYRCENAFMTLQDNRTGIFTDSTTNTLADLYTNTTAYNLGNIIAGTSINGTFNITSNNPGEYQLRIVCNSTNALGSPAFSAANNLTVNPNVYEANIQNPNSTSPISINAGDNITIRFNFTKNGIEIINNIEILNITVDETICTEIPGLSHSSGYWEVNCTTSELLTGGLKDLFLLVNYTTDPGIANDTNMQSINATPLTSPNITSIFVDEGGIAGEINLIAGRTTHVYCNATIEDVNGAQNIANVNATFFFSGNNSDDSDDNNVHYTDSSCSISNETSNSRDYSCSFDVHHYAVNGTWNCNMTALDSNSLYDSQMNITSINELYALNTSTSLIDYGQVNINNQSSEILVNVSNIGNQPINISVWGYGGDDPFTGNNIALVCPGNNISIEHKRFSTQSSEYSSKIQLNSTPKEIGFTIPKQTSAALRQNSTYWQLFIPDLDPIIGRGLCNGSVVFQAEAS